MSNLITFPNAVFAVSKDHLSKDLFESPIGGALKRLSVRHSLDLRQRLEAMTRASYSAKEISEQYNFGQFICPSTEVFDDRIEIDFNCVTHDWKSFKAMLTQLAVYFTETITFETEVFDDGGWTNYFIITLHPGGEVTIRDIKWPDNTYEVIKFRAYYNMDEGYTFEPVEPPTPPHGPTPLLSLPRKRACEILR